MKKNKLLSVLLTLFVATSVLMFSCVDDDFDTPPSTTIPVGEVKTIQELKNSFLDDTITVDMTVYATVTMDDKSGNIYKTAYIQDATGAIALHLDASGGIYQGDSIRIQLNGLKIGKYRELFQIDAPDGNGFTLDNYITKIQTLVNVEPETATISDINNNKASYQCKLVKLEGVQFVAGDTAATYADAENEESRSLNIEDANGNTVIVRSSGYAQFADESVPDSSGSLIAIVGQYNDDMQLIIRTTEEVMMENERLSGGGTGSGTGTFDDPYDVEAGISHDGATEVWVEGYLVGVYETEDASGPLADFVPSFTAPFYTSTNVIIADSDSETDISNCIVVQVPSGDIRNAVNLVDNGSNLGKLIKFKGDRETYFGEDGLKSVNGYWLDGSGINPEDPIDVVVIGTSTVVSSLNENFTGVAVDIDFDTNGWLNANTQGERYWQGKEYDGNYYIQTTAYGATSDNIENWVVTPGVELTTPKKLSFDTKTGYYQHAGFSVHVSTDFDGNNSNLLTSTWTQISPTIATGPSDGYGNWVNSGDVDLSSYSGTIYVLFKYIGDNSSNTTTFQLDNVQIVNL